MVEVEGSQLLRCIILRRKFNNSITLISQHNKDGLYVFRDNGGRRVQKSVWRDNRHAPTPALEYHSESMYGDTPIETPARPTYDNYNPNTTAPNPYATILTISPDTYPPPVADTYPSHPQDLYAYPPDGPPPSSEPPIYPEDMYRQKQYPPEYPSAYTEPRKPSSGDISNQYIESVQAKHAPSDNMLKSVPTTHINYKPNIQYTDHHYDASPVWKEPPCQLSPGFDTVKPLIDENSRISAVFC